MRCEVLAIGTELLLGQIVDTNSAWIGEQLAQAGIDSYEHRQVGDNLPRMVKALRELGISAYRSLASRRGISLPAQRLGKYKAFTQYCAVGFVLLPWTANDIGFQQGVLGVAVALTVVSGLDIVRHGWAEHTNR